jgi:hypothetical protein
MATVTKDRQYSEQAESDFHEVEVNVVLYADDVD